eukprot:CAMPEP_0202862614 /NCGR_PEP_ID=MMETSP1391-20130828/3592_1 /ASSEMBLY_ACC=CAM_ASM_000867 /TAXON_ID=1034604 /ORGANISM="Chlamydomonas leiostraca, Strain SAG 11-49" /LENGTH=419 /DNA_ID=CAMNT_0049542169 /DNA_START=192 /DNA_END=1451 /DNA_ORIENTATION=+
MPAAVEELYQQTRLAEQNREHERAAAVTIQKYTRGFLTRRRLDRFKDVVVAIQRVWRGYLGRQRAHLAREARDKRLREMYFAAMAITIQRHWRGFWSRKYVFDFYARKAYLQRVAQVNAQMRAELTEEGERAARAAKAAAEAAARRAFDDKVGRLHHLLSTASQPGIFNSPYAIATGTVPIIAGAPVEDHLKTAFRKQPPAAQATGRGSTFLPPIKGAAGDAPGNAGAQQRAQGARSPAGATNGSRRSAPQGGSAGTRRSKSPPVYPADVLLTGTGQVVPRHLTLRQVVPYDAVRQAEALEQKVSRAEMLMRHPLPFMSTTHKPDPPAMDKQTNRNMEGYQDPWDPTVGARNETFTPKQQTMSPHRFVRYGNQGPYFDGNLNVDAETLPPPSYVPAPLPVHAAGITSADLRRIAKQPAA